MPIWYVYILYSSKTNKYYTGSTDDLDNRLAHHNGGHTPSTKSGAPEWKIVRSNERRVRTSDYFQPSETMTLTHYP